MNKLSIKRRKFCEAYVVDGNGGRSYTQAGYSKSGAAVNANKLLKKPEIVAYIEELRAAAVEGAIVKLTDVIDELGLLALTRRKGLYDDDGVPKEVKLLTEAQVEILDLKKSDKIKSLEMLMKHLGGYAADNEQKQYKDKTIEELLKERAEVAATIAKNEAAN